MFATFPPDSGPGYGSQKHPLQIRERLPVSPTTWVSAAGASEHREVAGGKAAVVAEPKRRRDTSWQTGTRQLQTRVGVQRNILLVREARVRKPDAKEERSCPARRFSKRGRAATTSKPASE